MPDVAAPAHCFNFGFGCSWVAAGILNRKTPRQSLGSAGVSRLQDGFGWVWMGFAHTSFFLRPARGRLLHEAPSRARQCGSNRKADISRMLSVSAALSAVTGAGAVRRNVYNAEREKK